MRTAATSPECLGAVRLPREERNRPISLRDRLPAEHWNDHPVHREVLSAVGMGFDTWDLRTVFFEGETSLAWVGVYRDHLFTRRERRLFQGLVPSLRNVLRAERRVRQHRLEEAALIAGLEALGASAFIVGPGGELVHANTAGRCALDRRGGDTRQWLSTLLSRIDSAHPVASEATVTPLRAQGLRDHYLVVKRATASGSPERLEHASREWQLTRRQCDVLRLLCDGLDNADIAEQLGCSPRTVEQHVSAVMAKAKVEARSQVVCRVLAC